MATKAAAVKASTLATEIRAYCAANANAAEAARYARFFREGYDAWGFMDAKHPIWTEKEPQWFERFRGLGLPGFLKLGEALFASGKYEEGAIAVRFVRYFRDEIDGAVVERLARWFEEGIRNWAHTDVVCGELIGPALASGRAGLEAIAPWRQSPLPYQRRAVPVSMLALLKRDTVEVAPLLGFIQPLMTDSERVVQQGVGWFLREAWKKQPRPVERFLLEWKEEAPRLIYQYATEKMDPAARARFKRGKR